MRLSMFLVLVSASVLFHLQCVRMICIQVYVAEWPPFGKELLIRLNICSLNYFKKENKIADSI